MSNMSYCRFQNTVLELQDCLYSLEEQDQLSPEEEQAKKTLIKLCEQIACDFGDLSPERR